MKPLETRRVSVDDLILDPSNARKHGEKNLESIKGSLAKFGQVEPLVVQKGTGIVIGGNGRLAAMRAMGHTEVDIVEVDMDTTSATALGIALNRTSELAEWDAGVLGETLRSLQAMDFDLGQIGFDEKDLAALMPDPAPAEGLTEDDHVPELAPTRCKLGDLWLLGSHRLLCGDSTDVLCVDRLMWGEKADMVFTDPPYGIDLDTDYSSMGEGGQTHRKVANDDRAFDACPLSALFADVKEAFWFGANYYIESFKREYGAGSWFVWDKYPTDQNDKRFGSLFELVWSKRRHKQVIVRIPSLNVGHHKPEDIVHPTQKPSALVAWFLEHYSQPDDLVIDLFLGSGSTLIACEKTARRCFGMELDPKYCDVILARWEAFTGKTASLQSGETSG